MELRLCAACRSLRPAGTLCGGCGGPLTLADERLLLGETFGKYRLESVLGAGGMGVVYRATHSTLGRPAALKIVLPRAGHEGFERRFLREARVLAGLKHPAIVEIYDFDVSGWGLPYYVMECLEGRTLRGLIGSGPLGPELLAALLADVAPALTYAHRRGVVHRDLKPDNLFVAGFDGRAVVKVLDFGIAKLLDPGESEGSTDLTQSGAVVGTPHYLAPEQILSGEIGPWTDQYALALVVAESLVGRAVRAGKTLGQILSSEIRAPLDPQRLPPGLPEAQKQALSRATDPAPAARFPDVGSFVAALGLPLAEDGARLLAQRLDPQAPHVVTGTLDLGPATPSETPHEPTATVVASPGAPSTTVEAAAARRRVPRPTWLALAAAVLALGAVAAWLGRWRQEAVPAPEVLPSPGAPFAARLTLAVPPDATAPLALVDETVVLAGGQALYLAPSSGEGSPTRVPLAPGERLLGRAADGGLWLLGRHQELVHLEILRQERRTQAAGLPRFDPPGPDQELAQRLQPSPSGRFVAAVRAGEVEVCEAERGRCRDRFRLPRPAGSLELAVGERHLALALSTGQVVVHELPHGRRLSSHELGESRVLRLALDEDAGLLGVAGWFDHVDVLPLAGGPPRRLARQGRALDLAWLSDRPGLAIAGDRGVGFWDLQSAAELPLDTELRGSRLLVTGSGLLALDGSRPRLRLFDYGDLPPVRRARLSAQALWGLAAGDGQVFAGGQDGVLRRHDPGSGATQEFRLHSDGVTDLAWLGQHLASTSDDKTLAVWQLPAVSLVWRSQAHGYLVNQMHLRGGSPPTLWTSSSDGLVKQWGWPRLEPLQSVDTRQALGQRYSLHAVWASEDGRSLLLGTWNHALLALRRDEKGRWRGRAWPVESRVLYQRAEAPAARAVVLVGLYPHRVYVFDLQQSRLLQLPDFGLAVHAALPGPAAGEVLVPGVGGLLRYRLDRTATGGLEAGAWARFDTRLGALLCGALLPGARLALGTGSGELLLLDLEHLFGRELYRGPARPLGD